MAIDEHAGHDIEGIDTDGGVIDVCHTCKKTLGRRCEVYSRVVGYLRPVGSWNVGKKQEFSERKTFKV